MNDVTLVDTDILIDAGRNTAEAITFLEHLEEAGILAISAVTQMELMVGCQSKEELRSLEKFLSRFNIFAVNEHVSAQAVALLREYRLSHGLLIADSLIAATALHNKISFVSKNQKDYRFIANLNLLAYP